MADEYTWQVTGQVPSSQFDSQGNITTGKEVTFQISPSGYSGVVFVPDAIYVNPETVRELIQHEVDTVMAVHTLSG
jgi:hypothetical protein